MSKQFRIYLDAFLAFDSINEIQLRHLLAYHWRNNARWITEKYRSRFYKVYSFDARGPNVCGILPMMPYSLNLP
jgi:hypothetical protein